MMSEVGLCQIFRIWGASNLSKKDLRFVSTNTWVSGMCCLHADTPTRLLSGSAHEPQTFPANLRQPKNFKSNKHLKKG